VTIPDSPARYPWAVLAVLCTSLFMTAIDFTVLNLALPALAAELGVTDSERLWIVDVFPLTIAALLITVGSLADRYDRKRIWLAGMVVFGAASAFAALAWSGAALIAARIALGVGATAVIASTIALLRATFPDARRRSIAIGIWSASSSLGAACGPILGGVLVERLGWRSVFLVNIPVVAAAVTAGVLLVPRQPRGGASRSDPASSVLSVIAIASLMYGLNHAGANPAIVTAAFVVSGVAAVAAFVRRQRCLPDPLVDPATFRRRDVTLAAGVIMAGCDTRYR